jgi:integrase
VRASADGRHHGRTIPLAPEAVAALKSLAPGVGLVFGYCDFRASLRMAAVKVKLPADVCARISDHSIRHSRITDWAERSSNVAAIMHMAGHKSLQTTMGYIHTTEDQARDLLAATSKPGFRDTSRDTAKKAKTRSKT